MNGCLLPIVINLHIVCSGASCRIRTNDPEITNHVLWPTELKRRVGSYLHRAATTNYLCYVPVLEDSKGAGRARLTRFALQKYKKNKEIKNKTSKNSKIIHVFCHYGLSFHSNSSCFPNFVPSNHYSNTHEIKTQNRNHMLGLRRADALDLRQEPGSRSH